MLKYYCQGMFKEKHIVGGIVSYKHIVRFFVLFFSRLAQVRENTVESLKAAASHVS